MIGNLPRSQAIDAPDPWKVRSARITDIVNEIPAVRSYTLEIDELDAPLGHARPGQFNMLYLPGIGEAAISISGRSEREEAIHTIRAVGNVTRQLERAEVGDTLGVRGPFGTAWPLEQTVGKHLILVAGGIGFAPLRPVIYDIIRDRKPFDDVSVLIGARTPNDLLFAREYRNWERAGIEVEATVDHAETNWTGHIGVVTLLLNRLAIASPEKTLLFTCGPEVMMTYVIQTALRRGIPAANLYLSLERHMSCAIGQCGRCQFGPFFLCKKGPVVRYDHVAPLLEVADL